MVYALYSYDRYMLQQIVFIGYLGWCAFSATSIFLQPTVDQSQLSSRTHLAILFSVTAALAGFYTVFFIQKEPLTYYLYVAFPCFFWYKTFLRLASNGALPHRRRLGGTHEPRKRYSFSIWENKGVRTCVVALLALQSMVVSVCLAAGLSVA